MAPLWAWALLAVVACAVVAIDLFFAGRAGQQMTLRNSLAWSAVWLVAGVAFALPVWQWLGPDRAGEYVTGYLIERSLSLDNVFVFALIFAAFSVPDRSRQRALMWGIGGAIVLRVIMIFAGIALIETLHWVMYLLGAILIVTGVKMALVEQKEFDPHASRTLRLLRHLVPISDEYDERRLFTKRTGTWMATPLLAVFAVVATTDLVFAVDSIPAIFAITLDPWVVVSANVMALAGLRSLYFVLEGMMLEFRFLQPALAVLLVVIGAKLALADVVHIPVMWSLLVVVVTIGTGVVLSLLLPEIIDDSGEKQLRRQP